MFRLTVFSSSIKELCEERKGKMTISESVNFKLVLRKIKRRRVENPGIDPGTSRMLSGRSTTLANPSKLKIALLAS